jgi:hypothetical protein
MSEFRSSANHPRKVSIVVSLITKKPILIITPAIIIIPVIELRKLMLRSSS